MEFSEQLRQKLEKQAMEVQKAIDDLQGCLRDGRQHKEEIDESIRVLSRFKLKK